MHQVDIVEQQGAASLWNMLRHRRSAGCRKEERDACRTALPELEFGWVVGLNPKKSSHLGSLVYYQGSHLN